jgi:hypothetical protein
MMNKVGLGGGVVKDLINSYEGESSNLFCDDQVFFTSIVI